MSAPFTMPRSLFTLFIFVLCTFTLPVVAQDAGSNSTQTDGTGGSNNGVLNALDVARRLIAQTAVLGGITMAVGLFLLFFGQRFWKAAIFIAGFFVTAIVAYLILVNVEPSSGYPNRATVLLLAPLACGLLGGGLALCIWRVGIIALGATCGFLLAMFILSWRTGGVISSGTGRAIFIACFTGVGALAILILQKKMLVVATSIAGAYSIVFGIDCFVRAGLTDAMQQFLTEQDKLNWTVFERNGKVIGLLVSMIGFAAIGMIVQFRFFRKRDSY